MINEFSAGAVVFKIDADGKVFYLLLKNDQSNYWDFPKGKMEEGETLEQTALREIKEETGLDTELVHGFSDAIRYNFSTREGKNIDKEVTFFLGLSHSSDVKISDEHGDFIWLSFVEAYQKITYPNSRRVLERANQVLAHLKD